jgi:hypothetical protein
MVDCGADADMELLTLSSLLILSIDNRGGEKRRYYVELGISESGSRLDPFFS